VAERRYIWIERANNVVSLQHIVFRYNDAVSLNTPQTHIAVTGPDKQSSKALIKCRDTAGGSDSANARHALSFMCGNVSTPDFLPPVRFSNRLRIIISQFVTREIDSPHQLTLLPGFRCRRPEINGYSSHRIDPRLLDLADINHSSINISKPSSTECELRYSRHLASRDQPDGMAV
jgi:hypothetical protein